MSPQLNMDRKVMDDFERKEDNLRWAIKLLEVKPDLLPSATSFSDVDEDKLAISSCKALRVLLDNINEYLGTK